MAKLLTPALEAKILLALEKTAEFVDNDGLDPSTALAKAALAQGLGPGHINPMVAAYNQSRTRALQQSGESLFDKTATFELADAATVLERLYPDTPKSAARKQHDTAVSLEYSYAPTGFITRKAAAVRMPEMLPPLTDKKLPPLRTLANEPAERAKRAWASAKLLEREAGELRREVTAAYSKLTQAFLKLAEYFHTPGHIPIPVVRENVTITRGDKTEQIFDELVRLNPSLRKTASRTVVNLGAGELSEARPLEWRVAEKDAHFLELPAVGAPYTLVDDVLAAAVAWTRLRGPAETKQAEAAAAMAALTSPPPPVTDPVDDFLKKADGMGMVGSGYQLLQNAFKRTADGLVGDPDKNVQKSYDALTDPEHEAQLRQISTRANLQDLMTNDPVIRSYPNQDVLDAFNDISETAPSAADRQMVIRAALRRQLQQGQTDLFEADQLLGMENKLRTGARLGEGGQLAIAQ